MAVPCRSDDESVMQNRRLDDRGRRICASVLLGDLMRTLSNMRNSCNGTSSYYARLRGFDCQHHEQ
jgi:hypothetical protein